MKTPAFAIGAAVALSALGCSTQSAGPTAVGLFHEGVPLADAVVPTVRECRSETEAILEAGKLAAANHGEVFFLDGATGSMFPMIPRLVFLEVAVKRPMSAWKPGELISYTNAYGTPVTHVLQVENGCFFAKGVHNRLPDPGFIDDTNYAGTVVSLIGWGNRPITTMPVVVYTRTKGIKYNEAAGSLDANGFKSRTEIRSDDLAIADRLSAGELNAVDAKLLLQQIAWINLSKENGDGLPAAAANFRTDGSVYTIAGTRFVALSYKDTKFADRRAISPSG